MTTAPYGAWPSTITSSLLVEAAVGLSDLDVADGDLVWAELRPTDGGRVIPVRRHGTEAPVDLIPAPYSARSSVHEYGGRAFVVAGDTCWFVNFADQRIWSARGGSSSVALTAEADPPRSVRYADLTIDSKRRRIYAVRERHGVGGIEGADGVVNDLVAVGLDTSDIEVVAEGHDLYAAPRLSPDGSRLVYLAWDHPNMPWDESVLYALGLEGRGGAARVAGGGGESISQPRFAPDGTLHYLSDRSGFISLYREDGTAVAEIGADLGGPDWLFGFSSYDFFPDGTVVAAVETPLGAELRRLSGLDHQRLTDRFDDATYVRAHGRSLSAIFASASEPAAIATLDPADGSVDVIRTSRAVPVDRVHLSSPEALSVPSPSGEVHTIYYPPTNPDFEAPADELPPLIVISHGGPTSRSDASFDLRVQYFTNRGFAVADVNYGGSTGFGRAYRQRLDHNWGVVDVGDCVAVARHLAATGRADPDRLVIRGGSAGGYTTLCALTFSDAFAVGSSHYGISDLTALAADTHKFESRYLDRLVGPLPEAQAIFDERSPLLHVDQLACPVIFFQGLDDFVVPPGQSEVLVEALRSRGIPVAYLRFAGEGHGFRKAETIVAVAEAELSFLGAVLGFAPFGNPRPVEIENAEALSRES